MTNELIPSNTDNTLNSRDLLSIPVSQLFLSMYHKLSLPAFKIWLVFMLDASNKGWPEGEQHLPTSFLWEALGSSQQRIKWLNDKLLEIQENVVTTEDYITDNQSKKPLISLKNFHLLGATDITYSPNDNKIESISYNLEKEMINSLELRAINSKKFIIKLAPLLDLSTGSAPGLYFLALPYLHNKNPRTPAFYIDEFRSYLGIDTESYRKPDGNTDFRNLKARKLTPALEYIKSSMSFPFSLELDVSIENKQVVQIALVITLKKITDALPDTPALLTINKDEPTGATELRNKLYLYLLLPQAKSISELKEILLSFHLTGDLEKIYLTDYASDPYASTARIIKAVITTYQKWSSGQLTPGKGIYNYLRTILKTPVQDEIERQCNLFYQFTKKLQKSNNTSEMYSQIKRRLSFYHTKRYNQAYNSFSTAKQDTLKPTFAKIALQSKRYPPFVARNIKTGKPYTRNTTKIYQVFVTDLAIQDNLLPAASTQNFLLIQPLLRNLFYTLNIDTSIDIQKLEILISEKRQHNQQPSEVCDHSITKPEDAWQRPNGKAYTTSCVKCGEMW